MSDASPRLYTQAGCADSARVRTWLDKRRIHFAERNVTSDITAARELVATGVLATPLLIVGSRRIFGYRPAALRAAFDREGIAE